MLVETRVLISTTILILCDCLIYIINVPNLYEKYQLMAKVVHNVDKRRDECTKLLVETPGLPLYTLYIPFILYIRQVLNLVENSYTINLWPKLFDT